MTALVTVFCAIIGLAVGSFVNVVIWRVPRHESVLSPPSHCPGCAVPIATKDNIPVLSWMLLHGRCRHCGESISWRYPFVEVLCATVFVGISLRLGPTIALPGYLFLGAAGVALAFIDVDVHRLPNVLTFPTYLVGSVFIALASMLAGEPGSLVRAVVGMAGLYLLYFLALLAYPRGMGFGDVKLAGVLGLYLGYLGWGELAVGAFLGFLLGAVAGVLLIALRRGTRKSLIPFGPYMLVGALLGILAGGRLADLYLGVTLSR